MRGDEGVAPYEDGGTEKSPRPQLLISAERARGETRKRRELTKMEKIHAARKNMLRP
jgi:hypothetical protein